MNISKLEDGQGLVEYALILVLVAIVIIIILQVLGSSVMLVYATVVGGLKGQSLSHSGTEYLIIGYDLDVTPAGPGACKVVLSDVTVVVVKDGELSQNTTTGSIGVTAPGGSSSMSGTTDNNGIAQGLGTSLSGVGCPGKLTIGNTGHTININPDS